MKTSKQAGGSNYFNYAPQPDGISGKGPVPNYHIASERAIIDGQLDAMRESGQESIQLLLMLKQGANDGLYIPWSGGAPNPQCVLNLILLLNTIEAKGFRWVGIVPEFWGVNDFRQGGSAIINPDGTLNQNTLYGEHYAVLKLFRSLLVDRQFDYCIDLCAEADTSDLTTQVAQLLWTWWTGEFWEGGAPCWDATISFVGNDPTAIANASTIFRGTDPNGPVNWPARMNFHVYQIGDLTRCVGDAMAAGWPGGNVIQGECYTLTQPDDQKYAQDCRQQVLDHKILLERVIQFPVTPRDPQGVSCTTLTTGWGWGEAGL